MKALNRALSVEREAHKLAKGLELSFKGAFGLAAAAAYHAGAALSKVWGWLIDPPALVRRVGPGKREEVYPRAEVKYAPYHRPPSLL